MNLRAAKGTLTVLVFNLRLLILNFSAQVQSSADPILVSSLGKQLQE
jgi:hypothetical protein